jgi:predicted nucleic acid-binding protein
MKTYCLDTNCLIDAFKPESSFYEAMKRILSAYKAGALRLVVSRHSLSELLLPLEAVEFAKTLQVVEHYPVGMWQDQICTWKECAGTWDEARSNAKKLERLTILAKTGAGIRDKGGYIDAVIAGVEAFVTSDSDLVGAATAQNICNEFKVRIIHQTELAAMLDSVQEGS